MNLAKNLDLEKRILGNRLVFFQIEALTHPYNKLYIDAPEDTIIDDVLGFIRVPPLVIEEIKKAPMGGPVRSTSLGTEKKIELLFFNWHDVEHSDSFLETLCEKVDHEHKNPGSLVIWAFIPKQAIVEIATHFVDKDPEHVSIYRSYDRDMEPYVLTFEKKIIEEEQHVLGFYCRSFRA